MMQNRRRLSRNATTDRFSLMIERLHYSERVYCIFNFIVMDIGEKEVSDHFIFLSYVRDRERSPHHQIEKEMERSSEKGWPDKDRIMEAMKVEAVHT